MDREKVIKALEDADVTNGTVIMSNQFRDIVVALLKDQETVVLCRDCKHYGYHDMTNVDGYCYCLKRHEYPHSDWFCADGKRKET